MFIQTEQTPNPNSLKFLPGKDVLAGDKAEFENIDQAKASFLAADLFRVSGVKRVFFDSDFITVSKDENAQWALLKPQILAAIMEFYLSGQPILDKDLYETLKSGDNTAQKVLSDMDNEIVSQIKELLDTRVRPAVAMDGGDIDFSSFENGIVYLKMRGACAGCPSSTATLKMGVENMLKHFIPEVQSVEAVAEA